MEKSFLTESPDEDEERGELLLALWRYYPLKYKGNTMPGTNPAQIPDLALFSVRSNRESRPSHW
jgi:hypothetical protein